MELVLELESLRRWAPKLLLYMLMGGAIDAVDMLDSWRR